MIAATFTGRVGRDPEVKFSADSGNAWLTTSAVFDSYDYKTKQKISHWVSVMLYGKLAERYASIVKKGAVVMFTGTMEPLSEKDTQYKASFKVRATDFYLAAWPTKSDGVIKPSEPTEAELADADLPF